MVPSGVRISGLVCCLGLAACTPAAPTMSVDQAQTYCRGQVSKPVDTDVTVGIGIGTGGKVRTTGGVTVGVNLNSLMTPNDAYASCVKKNSGEAPKEPFRPEA